VPVEGGATERQPSEPQPRGLQGGSRTVTHRVEGGFEGRPAAADALDERMISDVTVWRRAVPPGTPVCGQNSVCRPRLCAIGRRVRAQGVGERTE